MEACTRQHPATPTAGPSGTRSSTDEVAMKVLQVEFNELSPQPASLAPFVRTVGAMVRDSSRTGARPRCWATRLR